jgi:transposase-like protein
MALRFSDEAKCRITAMIECDMSNEQIQSEIKVSTTQLYRYRSNLRAFGRIDPPPLKKLGRERKLTEEEEEVRLATLNARILAYTVCAGLA